jgi:hypothetical protein
VGEKIINFIDDIKQNGLKTIKAKVVKGFKNAMVHFESTENFKALVSSLKERLNLQGISRSFTDYLEKLNDRLLGNRKTESV